MDALKAIRTGGGAASGIAKTAAVSAIHSLMMDPSFRRRSVVSDAGCNRTEGECWKALGSLGPTAVPAIQPHEVPLLLPVDGLQ